MADDRRGRTALPAWAVYALIAAIAVLAAIVRHRALDLGLMSDDFAQYGMLRGLYPGEHYAPFDLYAFFRDDPALRAAHVEAGTIPWWTTPELHGTVLRPLASALRTLDHALWPAQSPAGLRLAHLHSLVWLALLIAAAGLALVRALPRSIALLAVALIACGAGYATPLGWLANRCSLISATFVCLAVWAHLGWRGPPPPSSVAARPRRWQIIEITCVVLALAAGEYGLAAPAYILALELLSSADSTWTERARAAAPAVLVALLWLGLHRALGYGTTGSAVYVDPLTQPRAWLEVAGDRLPRLLASGIWGIPADTGDMLRRFGDRWVPSGTTAYVRAHVLLSLASLVVAALVGLLVRTWLEPGERRRVLGLAAGAGLAVVPLTVAPAHTRLLIGAQLGFAAIVAAAIVAGVRGLSRWRVLEGSRRERVLAILAAPILALATYAHSVAELRWDLRYLDVLAAMNASIDAAFEGGDLLGDDLGERDVIVINVVGQTTGFHGQYWLDLEGWPTPRSWRPLAMGEFAMVARRIDADTLELSAIQGAWLRTGAEQFFRRGDRKLPAGTAFALPGLRVEITADDGAGHPTRIEFGFPASLDDPRYLFLVSTAEGLRRWPVPELGARAPVPRPRLPLVTE